MSRRALTVALVLTAAAALAWIGWQRGRYRDTPTVRAGEITPLQPASARANIPRKSSEPTRRASASPSRTISVPAHSLHEEFLDRLRSGHGNPRLAKDVLSAHLSIVDAMDDPAWARPMEGRLSDFILAQPEAAGLEVEPIVCRQSGCELRVLGSLDDATPGPGGPLPGWQAISSRLHQEPWRSEFAGSPFTLVTRVQDRTLYLTILKRTRN